MTRPRGDAGSIAPLVPVFAFIMLLLGGLVIDASRQLNARGRAVAFAEEAARAGASAIVRGQADLRIDRAMMRTRVEEYCAAVLADRTGGVTLCRFKELRRVSDDDARELVVVVEVALSIPASLLGLVGVDTLDAAGEGRARPYEGVDPFDVDSSPPPVDVPVPVDPPDAPPEVDVPVFPEPPPLPSPEPSIDVSIPPSGAPSGAATPAPTPAAEPTPAPTP